MTAPEGSAKEGGLRWQRLSVGMRKVLEHKLEGLYGQKGDGAAFDSLQVDKQQSLLIFARRFQELDLWSAVRRVENVYGQGGVGMNFAAWPALKSKLSRDKIFTTRFANHHDASGGFIERGRGRASLHILFVEDGEHRWAAHFDLYNPRAWLLNTWRHLLYEKFCGVTPDWRAISDELWDKRDRLLGNFT